MGDLEDMSECIPLLLPAGRYRFHNLVNFMHSSGRFILRDIAEQDSDTAV